MTIKAIITDIEGTTSSISFVHDVLFPYAYEKMEEFINSNTTNEQVKAILEEVEGEDPAKTLKNWIKEDRKEKALKDIQGMIWQEGYQKGELKGHVYKDALEKLKSWHEKSIPIYIYSSGSVQAQKLIFGYSEFGDLNYLFKGYFDTKIGAKKEKESYIRIAQELELQTQDLVFLSDNEAELIAAHDAGFRCIHLARESDKVAPSQIFSSKADFTAIEI